MTQQNQESKTNQDSVFPDEKKILPLWQKPVALDKVLVNLTLRMEPNLKRPVTKTRTSLAVPIRAQKLGKFIRVSIRLPILAVFLF